MKTYLYYFTGTGNTFSIAQTLQGYLPCCEVKHITKESLKESVSDAIRIGILFPVYYQGIPKMVEQFLKNLEVQGNPYIFAIANFGKDPGISFVQIEHLLKMKGLQLRSNFALEMPGNMWPLYYPHPQEVVVNRLKTEKIRVQEVAQKILEEVFIPIAEVEDREAKEKTYNEFHPESSDKGFWLTDNCISCGTCRTACPANNITMEEGFPVWHHGCEMCLACFHGCPQKAIEFKTDSIDKERYMHP